jgi:hypothetical protein
LNEKKDKYSAKVNAEKLEVITEADPKKRGGEREKKQHKHRECHSPICQCV